MTEVTLNKRSFVATLEAIKTHFEFVSHSLTIETEPDGARFALTAKQASPTMLGTNAPDVRAFGPCEVKGDPVSIVCDISDLESAIINAYKDAIEENLTLLIGDGIWVKEPHSAETEARM